MSAESLFIGQLSKQSGLSRDTLRFYEREGILRSTRLPNNYRVYRGKDIDRLRFVESARAAGFSLREIQSLLHLAASGRGRCSDYEPVARRKLHDIEARIKALEDCRQVLEQSLVCCGSREDTLCSNMPR